LPSFNILQGLARRVPCSGHGVPFVVLHGSAGSFLTQASQFLKEASLLV